MPLLSILDMLEYEFSQTASQQLLMPNPNLMIRILEDFHFHIGYQLSNLFHGPTRSDILCAVYENARYLQF